ncbi:DNA replication initiation control protein YabA [Sporolactobacillus vineae]|uniref:DNA replication initiation control protein YabA n=1 Tax=Sporolactobacillus vineae TaxID=444463 RepID=UPI0002898D1E|nr:DNA replication initiation control protein YabA [Sporolactobacillus vineae]
MEEKEFFSQVSHLEEQLGQIYVDFGNMKAHLADLMEENHNLQLENRHLRERIEKTKQRQKKNAGKSSADAADTSSFQAGEGYDNLARLYQEGFHICNLHYGSVRKDGDCLFCLAFLNKK